MAEEMHNFYQEENLHMYAEGSTPSLSQDSYTGIAGENEDERLVLVTKNDLERRLAASEHSNQVRPDQLTCMAPLGLGDRPQAKGQW